MKNRVSKTATAIDGLIKELKEKRQKLATLKEGDWQNDVNLARDIADLENDIMDIENALK